MTARRVVVECPRLERPMCLAIPAKVLEKKGNTARVDFGGEVIRDINISLVNVKVDDYVIVHAGFAIQVLDQKSAEESLRLWDEILSAEK